MILQIRFEKLRFLIMEMRLAMHMARFAPTDAESRMLTRHVLIRAVDFVSHARKLRKPLMRLGVNASHFREMNSYYAEVFNEYFQKVRDRLSAHVQDLEFSEGIDLWNSVDDSKSEFFIEAAIEIYHWLESLEIDNVPVLDDFQEITDPAFEEVLRTYQSSGCKVQTVEIGTDPLALTRPNSTAMLNGHPIHVRAGQLALIQRWIGAQVELFIRCRGFPNATRILKARILTDLVSALDCLITRDVPSTALQSMDGLDVLLEDEHAQKIINNFKENFKIEEAITPYRFVRNKFGSHLEEEDHYPLETLFNLIDDIDISNGLGIYDKIRHVFEKLGRECLYLRPHLVDGKILNGVLGANKNTGVMPFSNREFPGRIVPQPEKMKDTEEAYTEKLEEWLTGGSDQQERARSAFWDAFLHSPIIEEYPVIVINPQWSIRKEKMRSLRLAHCFILKKLKTEREPNRTLGIIELLSQCSNGAPDELTEVLIRYISDPKCAPYMSAIANCFGEVASWNNFRARTYLISCMNTTTSLAVFSRIALMQMFIRTEGTARLNRHTHSENLSDVLKALTDGLGTEAKLMTEIFLASQFCHPRIANFSEPFEEDYANLQIDIVSLISSLAPTTEAPRISDMVRQLSATHDYIGICLYLYDELKGGEMDYLINDLMLMVCDGIIKAASHDQSRKHLCGCFLRLERYHEALGIAQKLAFSNPDAPDMQILLAQVMTYLPQHHESVRSIVNNIRGWYRLSISQQELLNEVISNVEAQ